MLDIGTHNEQRRGDRLPARVVLQIGLVGGLLVTQQRQRIAELTLLRLLTLVPGFPVDQHRGFHEPVRNRLMERVTVDDGIALRGRGRQPDRRCRGEIT
ncbi:hypothetical protein B840_12500 (plasmid) [Corynebacterium marinum DSM 44953]|uniref:Uncharacterized protein n=1 Tax=Corynebacterium marinum DSM 44953 TaxID=1224162 RepID=A0A0B6TQ70_9CORY|nr:hypothetical protein B840_12500 [Corynebacterium marinum DSM 44953]